MVYTSGIVLDNTIEESLEQLQDNKLTVVCEKLNLNENDRYALQPFRSPATTSTQFSLVSSTLVADGVHSSLTPPRTTAVISPV